MSMKRLIDRIEEAASEKVKFADFPTEDELVKLFKDEIGDRFGRGRWRVIVGSFGYYKGGRIKSGRFENEYLYPEGVYVHLDGNKSGDDYDALRDYIREILYRNYKTIYFYKNDRYNPSFKIGGREAEFIDINPNGSLYDVWRLGEVPRGKVPLAPKT